MGWAERRRAEREEEATGRVVSLGLDLIEAERLDVALGAGAEEYVVGVIRPGGAPSNGNTRRTLALSEETVARVEALAQKHGTTTERVVVVAANAGLALMSAQQES